MKYVSGRVKELGVGVTDYSENRTSLSVIGNANIGAGVTIDGAAGIVSATEFYGSGENLTGITASTFGTLSNLDVSGISTLGNVKFETAGIVTAVSGIVTYYGDGQYLDGITTDATTLKDSGETIRDNTRNSSYYSSSLKFNIT